MFNQIFNYHSKEVRTVVRDNQIYFVAKDVCEALENCRLFTGCKCSG